MEMKKTTRNLNRGVVVFLDLNNFEDAIKLKNWGEYKPNPITSYLTNSLKKIIYNHQAAHIWGINEIRGTEEAILLFYKRLLDVEKIFRELKNNIEDKANKLGVDTKLSIGIARGPISDIPKIKSHSKNEFKKHPTLFLAYKALKKAKSKGGNSIVIF